LAADRLSPQRVLTVTVSGVPAAASSARHAAAMASGFRPPPGPRTMIRCRIASAGGWALAGTRASTACATVCQAGIQPVKSPNAQ
jgi:hypothetical protein